jgi:hypothetical protein
MQALRLPGSWNTQPPVSDGGRIAVPSARTPEVTIVNTLCSIVVEACAQLSLQPSLDRTI